ncbi:hypothetical protein ACIRVK_44055 [Streptomyces sp. NPDC101152]|uniref:hypothetical protein n=1 Tax=Streptomyces sp. NPDC101152 TaxID=3366116 RepID=UPI00381E18C6
MIVGSAVRFTFPREAVLRRLFRAGLALGGALSGEPGIGTAKQPYFLELENPVGSR